MNFLNETFWDPYDLLLSPDLNSKYAILILNTPINTVFKTEHILNLWNNALIRITVDGGTDRWLGWLENNKVDIKTIKNINLITGDMDSIRSETLNYYKSTCTQIVNTYDQDETDFTKAVLQLKVTSSEECLDIQYVIVLNSVYGRFDQLLGNLNTLHKINHKWPEIRIIILSDNATWLLPSGKHRIKVPKSLRRSQEWCALIPVGSKAYLSTSGLKWNLDNSPLEFGYMVSTSNTYSMVEEDVVILTDKPIIWSMGIKKILD